MSQVQRPHTYLRSQETAEELLFQRSLVLADVCGVGGGRKHNL